MILYGKAKSGKLKQWQAWTEEDLLIVEYGYVGGKLTKQKKKCYPKNEGKKNATTAEEQAVKQLNALYTAQITKERYRKTVEELDTIPQAPMLAKKFNPDKAQYPYYAQPKLNGVRCLAKKVSDTEIVYTSRKFKAFTTLAHLTLELLNFLKVGETADGEIYVHGWDFQDIISAVKKKQPRTERLQYWIYDMADGKQSYRSRMRQIHWRFKRLHNQRNLVPVETVLIQSKEGLEQVHKEWVSKAFEGTIIRDPEASYIEFRTKALQKKKDFHDKEYRITGATRGEGSHEGCIIFVCETEKGQSFNVTPKYPLERRREMYSHADDYIGKSLTVRYQELSKDGIPIFPVGIAIRDYE